MIGLLASMAREVARAPLGRMFFEGAVRSAGAAAGMLAVHEAARMLRENRERRLPAPYRRARRNYVAWDWGEGGDWR